MLKKRIFKIIEETMETAGIDSVTNDSHLINDLLLDDECNLSDLIITLEDEFCTCIDYIELEDKILSTELETVEDLIDYLESMIENAQGVWGV